MNVILSFGQFLDVLPIRASKGLALRYMAATWGIPWITYWWQGIGSRCGYDARQHWRWLWPTDTMKSSHSSKMWSGSIFAKADGAAGILEALNYYDFFRIAGCRSRLNSFETRPTAALFRPGPVPPVDGLLILFPLQNP